MCGEIGWNWQRVVGIVIGNGSSQTVSGFLIDSVPCQTQQQPAAHIFRILRIFRIRRRFSTASVFLRHSASTRKYLARVSAICRKRAAWASLGALTAGVTGATAVVVVTVADGCWTGGRGASGAPKPVHGTQRPREHLWGDCGEVNPCECEPFAGPTKCALQGRV